jgi:translation initiation factor IF-3
MKRTWRRPQKRDDEKKFRVNEQIRVPEIFLIDENGNPVGNIETAKALAMAREAESDLVEVNPLGRPPVVKIMDYGQFKYEREKLAHKQKQQQKKVETKSVRLTVRISQNDFNFKLEQAKGFLEKSNKVKVELVLKGRERQHPGKAVETIKKFYDDLAAAEGLSVAKEQDLTRKGAGFSMILFNKIA